MYRLVKIILPIAIFLSSCAGNKDSSGVKWINSGGGPNYDGARDLGIDKDGNVYILGRFQGSGKIGNIELTGKGDDEIFLAKYNSGGDLIWAKTAGGKSEDAGYGLVVSPEGICYIHGFFSGEAFFDETKITSLGKSDIFTASYDQDGNVIWVNSAGTTANDNGRDLAIDAEGNLLCTGSFSGSLTIESTTIQGYEFSEDIYIIKYNKEGKLIWATSAGKNKSNDRGSAISTDQAGNIYIAGYFTKTAWFDQDSLKASEQAEAFLAKYNKDGKLAWVRQAGEKGWDEGMCVVAEKNGGVYLSGFFTKQARFDTIQEEPYKANGERDVFTAKYSSDGTLAWVKTGGGPVIDEPRGINIKENGNLLVTGFFGDSAIFESQGIPANGEYDIFVLEYNPDGELLLAEKSGSAKYDEGRSILPITKGYYLAGGFNDVFKFGDNEVTPIGDFDFFLYKKEQE